MKCVVAVVFGLLAVATAQGVSYSFANPAGVTYRGYGFQSPFSVNGPVSVAGPVAGPVAAPVAVAQPVQYAQPGLQYAQPALQYAQHAPVAVAAPAVAVHQKVGYAHTPVLTRVPGVANVPVTKLAYTQGVHQKLVDVAQPAVTTRKVKVRRPALRKEFYDIEHRVIVRPAGSATLELSQPISKEQKGPTVLTPTNYQQIAPVVRYGTSRRIIDGAGVSDAASIRVNLARGIGPAGPAPQGPPQPPQAPLPRGPPLQLRANNPAPRPLQLRPQPQPQPQEQPQQFEQQQQQDQQQFAQQQQQQQQQFAQQQQQQRQQFAQQQQQQPQQQQQQQPQQQQFLRSEDDGVVINAEEQQFDQQPQQQQGPNQQGPVPQGPQQGPPQPPPAPQPRPQLIPGGPQSRGINITPDMPIELQNRLLGLLSAKGGTVTEILGENGRSADSASVLQVADALQDVNLQGGERITTRRIVVTRPIETIQEVDIQEPATKVHRVAVNQPVLYKHAIQGVAQVPVDVPAVKHLATPVVRTTYAQAAPIGYASGPVAAGPAYAY